MADETNVTVIAADTQIKGEMVFENSCKLLGRFEGTITAKGQLHVAEGAVCKAQVEAGVVIVDGLIEGNVMAKDRIHLNSKAKINGDIMAGKLIMAEGAVFNGHVAVGVEAVKNEVGRPAAAAVVTPVAPAGPVASAGGAVRQHIGGGAGHGGSGRSGGVK